MRLPCRLREIRERRSLTLADVDKLAEGIPKSALSQIERGVMTPPDKWLEALEEVYGAPLEDWYSPRVLAALAPDEMRDQ